MEHLQGQHISYGTQYGILSGLFCLSNLLSTLNTVTQPIDDGKDISRCFLDFIEAFDDANHRFLVARLAILGISPQVIDTSMSYLANSVF